ncbi:MAG: hypothetical protein WCP09_03025 [Candidatus Taylorbacteria bacterium]
MDDDIIIEPGKEPVEEGGSNSPQQTTDVTSTTPPEAPYSSEQVFEVSSDLNILPLKGGDMPEIPEQKEPIKPIKIEPVITIPPQNIAPIPGKPLATTEKVPTPTQTSYPFSSGAEKTIPGLAGIRTYEGDVAKTITSRGTSAIDMAMAEKRRETGDENVLTNSSSPTSHKKSILIIISLVLILAGLGGGYYLYSISPLAVVAPQVIQTKATSLVPSDAQSIVAVDGLGSIDMLRAIQGKISSVQNPGTITEIVPYTTDLNGIKGRVTAQQMIKTLKIPAPDLLTRSLTPSWMLGVFIDSNNEKNVFIVAKNNFFQNAFAGMLAWESVMPDDLKRYLFSVAPQGVSNSASPTTSNASLYADTLRNIESLLPGAGDVGTTSTSSTITSSSTSASTTPEVETLAPVIPYFTLRGQFQDKIVKNKDVREFITAEGDTLFLYSFIDNNRLVISTNEDTLAEIILRLEREAYVR